MLKNVKHVERIEVCMDLDGVVMPVGTLAWSVGERRSYFEYDRTFLDHASPLSPFKLRYQTGAQAAPHTPFDGLHGLFNDSLPDGWGRKLLDRRLERMGYDHRTLNPLDRLSFVGYRGMGALRYRPIGLLDNAPGKTIDLDWMAEQVVLVQADVPGADIEHLQAAQGASGGVRPKIVVGLDVSTGSIIRDGNEKLPAGYSSWMVKFRATEDPKEIGAEEYAYSLMAKAAGIEMPETLLLKGSSGARYFAVARFDRSARGSLHVHTLGGLLDADHRLPSVDYGTLLNVTRLLTRDERHVSQMFRRMVFNVLARNRDDHSKNHAFLMGADRQWRPTPAYDVTFSIGPGGEHNLTIGGEGRNPGHGNILAEAQRSGVRTSEAEDVYSIVRNVVKKWPEFAAAAGLSARRTTEIDQVVNRRSSAPK